MLLNLYNQKEQHEYEEMYVNVVINLLRQIEEAKQIKDPDLLRNYTIQSKQILDQFISCIQKLMRNV